MKVRLGDCLTMIKNGATISQKSGASGLPITRIETLSNGEFNRDRMGYADIFDSKKYESYILDDGDLLLSHINSRTFLGRTVIYQKEGDEQIIHGMNLLRLKTDPSKLDNFYAYYLFQTAFFKKNIDNIRKDAINQSSITTTDIQNIILDIPDLPTQKQVAKVLSDIDSKIALNRRINQKLEETARCLYDYWFLQFDFPAPAGSITADGQPIPEGAPYRSSGGAMSHNATLNRPIPTGWEVKNLYHIAKFTNGLACQKFRPTDDNHKLPVIKIGEMHGGITDNTEYVRDNIPDRVKVYDGDILFSWSASLEVMLWAYGNGGLNQHIFKVTSNNGYPKSFYFYELLDYVQVFKKIADSRKTTMGHITSEHLEQSEIPLPPTLDIPNAFEKEVAPLLDQQVQLNKEIIRLKALRDRLLPLLINGQVTLI